MANRFWVGGTGNWNDTAHWSTLTGGSSGASVPVAGDAAILDGSSGGGTATANVNVACDSITMGAFVGTFDANGFTVTLKTFSCSGSAVRTVTMGSGTWTLTGNAATIFDTGATANLTFNRGTPIICNYSGPTGTRTFTIASTMAEAQCPSVSITAGTDIVNLVTNVFNVDFTGFSGTLQNNARTIYGNLTVSAGMSCPTGNTTTFAATSGTKTITTNSTVFGPNVVFDGVGGTWQLAGNLTLSGSGLTLTNGSFDANGKTVTFTGNFVTITGGFTFFNLTITGGAVVNAALTLAGNQTITGTLTINGSSSTTARLLVKSSVIGTPRTLTASNNPVVTNTDFKDITGAGTGTWNLSAVTGLSGDCGGNSGITFTTTATQTATGTSSFSWSTHGWTSRVPLPQDNVVINNAFSAGQTVTADMARLGKSITFGCSGSPTLTRSVDVTLFGSLDLTGVATFTAGTNVLSFGGRSSFTLTPASLNLDCPITFEMFGGTLQLQTDTSCGTATARTIIFTAGTFDLNDHIFTHFGTVTNTGAVTRVLAFGTSGLWNLTNTATSTVWNALAGSNFSTTGTGTIKITGSTVNVRTFAGGGFTYSNIWFTNATANGFLNLTGSNTFADFKCTDTNGQSIRFTAGTTTTVSTFTLSGGASQVLILSITAATHTLSKVSGTVSVSNCTITNSIATGGATWNSLITNGNVNNGGNTGWIFSASTFNFSQFFPF